MAMIILTFHVRLIPNHKSVMITKSHLPIIVLEDSSIEETNVAGLLEVGEKLKALGNDYFKKGAYDTAIDKYEKALRYLVYAMTESEEDENKLKAVKLSCHLNNAACHLKLKAWSSAVSSATMVRAAF